jgi:hypothetical protein
METVDTESRVYTTRNVASLVASAFRDCRPEWMNLITDYLVSHGGMARHGLFARQEAAAYSTILSERPLCFVPGTLMSSLIVEVLKRSDRATLFPTFEATKPFPYDSDVDEKLHSEIADLASRFDVGTTCVAKAMTFVQSNVVAWIEIIPIPGRPAWFQEITTHLALYPHISHISHSCAPNIEFSKADRFAPNPLHIMSVYAIKPISVGDELFITLLHVHCRPSQLLACALQVYVHVHSVRLCGA